MSDTKGQRFLVRAGAGFGVAAFGAAPGVGTRKLFDTAPDTALGADAQPRAWHAVDLGDGPEANPWDTAHAMLRPDSALFGTGGVDFVEPDLYQSIDRRPSTEREPFATAGAAPCAPDPQDPRLPQGSGFGWHLGPGYSGLAQARSQAGTSQGANVVIAHLDTGFDPNHLLNPAKLDLDRQRNFAGDGQLNDARDITPDHVLTNRGHGPATLALLAGGSTAALQAAEHTGGITLGGAPGATVVPIRVADSVVHFWTSAIAEGIAYAAEIGADVLSLSMGGVASLAWAEAVNKAYEAGVVLVAAAGNNFAQLPTRNIVYPARFRRVIAATGIMANHRPYQNQPANIMQGNYGPASKMNTALAAYTPNVPWAKLGCRDVAGMDGSGTSSATPQIAAAAALWIAAHRPALANLRGWQKVEAVREALFATAEQPNASMRPEEIRQMLGRGALQADAAIARGVDVGALRKTPDDSATFAFLRLLTGLGISGQESQPAMMRLEMTQLAQSSRIIEEALDDPDAEPEAISDADRRRFMDAVIADPRTSRTLRRHIEGRATRRRGRGASETPPQAPDQPSAPTGRVERRIVAPPPAERRLRIFASDPSLAASMDTARLSEVTVSVPWEGARPGEPALQPGPVGEYLEIVDVDPASGAGYAPVDLNDPHLLAADGHSPSESNPQFHQQMVYAVAMTTIRHFEHALGRAALWAPDRRRWTGKDDRREYENRPVRRLRIYPHALREANAYYSPSKKALLFGYFPAAPSSSGSTVPGSTVFTCLSHDIIAHETTHALLDGLHRRYAEATNPDMPAFHEAFADIVAIFQHFSLPGLLEQELQRTQGDLQKGDRLAQLAQQFGQGIGRSAALRTFIGDDTAIDYRTVTKPHDRGAILVSAVFAAFLAIYRSRAADLLRIAADGSTLLRQGSIHPDLLARLADEARKSATHVLRMCIRALDYCPPVDLTFGDYLRALITADADLVPADIYGYRVAFLEAFRRRSIYPDGLRTISVESLRWQAPAIPLTGLSDIVARLDLSWDLEADRMRAAGLRDTNGLLFHDWLETRLTPDLAAQLGLRMNLHRGGDDAGHGRCTCKRPDPAKPVRTVFEVHSVRPARRVAPDGSFRTDLVIQLTQRRCECLDPDTQPAADGSLNAPGMWMRGGSTLLIDTRRGQEKVLYCISKRIDAPARLEHQREYLSRSAASLRALYFGAEENEPFAALHRGH